MKTFDDLLFYLDREYPIVDQLCGGPVSLVIDYDNKQCVVECTDASDGWCEGVLTANDCLEVAKYFTELSSLIRFASLHCKKNDKYKKEEYKK